MIVVVNPSVQGGHSFKGLHQYCSHDAGMAASSERVEWMDTRNIGLDDPKHAWKVMVATATAQNDLKRANGIRTGPGPKDGPVLHVILSFDSDEPSDRAAMEFAADELLSKLGADPARMRGKAKPKHKQFASEHQVAMYAHSDTEHRHLHLMINRVHPETGRLLPDSNDFLKVQNWALDYSKQHGTSQKTPAREENDNLRKAGEYVKGDRRKSRNVFELERTISEFSNDNDRFEPVRKKQAQKDKALAQRGRMMKALHFRAKTKLAEEHLARKEAINRTAKRQINRETAQVREEFRLKLRDLQKRQLAEREVFVSLENTLFGKASNIVRTMRVSAQDIRDDKSGIISRSFRILSNAGERQAFFEKAQDAQRRALAKRRGEKIKQVEIAAKLERSSKLEEERRFFELERIELKRRQTSDRKQLDADWEMRTHARQQAFASFAKSEAERRDLPSEYNRSASPAHANVESLLKRYSGDSEFRRARRAQAREQNNESGRDDDFEH